MSDAEILLVIRVIAIFEVLLWTGFFMYCVVASRHAHNNINERDICSDLRKNVVVHHSQTWLAPQMFECILIILTIYGAKKCKDFSSLDSITYFFFNIDIFSISVYSLHFPDAN
ncbi:hypothetical protein BDQ17DRAFT_1334031 [Cyathus striatus]|nr:hypothetical protein BDQ17DRAFT_1334031 [Cyathus striatus]